MADFRWVRARGFTRKSHGTDPADLPHMDGASGIIVADASQRIVAADRILMDTIGRTFRKPVEGRLVADVLVGSRKRLPIEGAKGELLLRARHFVLRVTWAALRLEGEPGDPSGLLFSVERV